jgi:hypothetical protein
MIIMKELVEARVVLDKKKFKVHKNLCLFCKSLFMSILIQFNIHQQNLRFK